MYMDKEVRNVGTLVWEVRAGRFVEFALTLDCFMSWKVRNLFCSRVLDYERVGS